MSTLKLFAIRSLVKAGSPAYGVWLTMPGNVHARTVAMSSPPPSWICVDCEHGLVPIQNVHDSISGIITSSSSPPSVILRVPATGSSSSFGWQIKLALDGGADGIVVPMVETVEQAKEIVAWSRFPPTGKRGMGSPFTHQLHGQGLSMVDYFKEANERILVMVQIETVEGFKNVEEIAKVEGLDCIFAAPFDLSLAHGLPPPSPDPHPQAEEMIQKILAVSKQNRKMTAIYCTSGVQGAKRAAQGFDIISINSDVNCLNAGLSREFSTVLNQATPVKTSGY